MQKLTFAEADICRVAHVQEFTGSHVQRQTFAEADLCRGRLLQRYTGTEVHRFTCTEAYIQLYRYRDRHW